MNGKSKTLALALLIGSFMVGGVVGALVDRSLVRGAVSESSGEERGHDRDRRQSYMDWLAAELDLTDDQREHVAAVLETNREEVRALWRETRPAFEELRDRLRAQVREALTEEQQTAYDSLLASEHDRRRGRR
jgi:hypothetical protein